MIENIIAKNADFRVVTRIPELGESIAPSYVVQERIQKKTNDLVEVTWADSAVVEVTDDGRLTTALGDYRAMAEGIALLAEAHCLLRGQVAAIANKE